MDIQDLVSVNVGTLSAGEPLQHDLYGDGGRLLLSAGATVTASIKSLLTDRGIESVRVHRDDAISLVNPSASATSGPAVLFDSELAEQLNAVIDDGLFGSEEFGPAVRDSMVIHDRAAYDAEHRQRMISLYRETNESLNSVMSTAMKGGPIDGREVKRLTTANLDNMTEDCESAITVATEADDKGVSGQSLQTSLLAMAIGIEMGWDAESVWTIGSTGLVADWGMMHLPDDVRGLKRQLDERQFYEIQKVPIFTANMLQRTSALPRLVLPVAYQVHEKIDGSGYPRGRDGNTIHPFAKIIHVADCYTSHTSPGPGRQPAMPYAAMENILHEARKGSVDADVARALLRVLSLFPIGSYVALSDKSMGRVMRTNRENYTLPVVQIVVDGNGNRIDPDDKIAIIAPDEAGLEIVRALPTPGRNEIRFCYPVRRKPPLPFGAPRLPG